MNIPSFSYGSLSQVTQQVTAYSSKAKTKKKKEKVNLFATVLFVQSNKKQNKIQNTPASTPHPSIYQKKKAETALAFFPNTPFS